MYFLLYHALLKKFHFEIIKQDDEPYFNIENN